MVDFNIGDEVIVYYDGVTLQMSYPLQINTVYAISLKDPANFEVKMLLQFWYL